MRSLPYPLFSRFSAFPPAPPAAPAPSFSGSFSGTSGNRFAHAAEADHDAPHVGLEHVASGNARVPPDDSAPGAAARHAILSVVWALRVGLRTLGVIRDRIPVLHPFPDVPQHVIQSKCVRLF